VGSVAIPFELRGIRGVARIRYGANEDPLRWGYDLLPFDIERARGCPVLEAGVEYPADGYASNFGWVQIIRYGRPSEAEVAIVDLPPQLADSGIPWVAWGARPTLFDAPSTSDRDFRFRADTFLAASPDSVMTPVVEPICGFSWGYRVDRGAPTCLPLTLDGLTHWASARKLLTEHCPGWTFRGPKLEVPTSQESGSQRLRDPRGVS
jgi:hypothetical protein